MKDILKKRAVIVGLAIFAAVLILVLSAVFFGGRSSFLKSAASAVSAPFKKGVSAAASGLEHLYGYMYKYDSLAAENEQLRLQIAEMENLVRDSEAISEENERYRELLGFAARHSDFTFESATVTSWTASNFSSAFTISKGSSSGIKLNDSVVSSDGCLIGTVTELGPSSATVTTVVDTTFSAGALVESSGVSCVAAGDFELMRKGQLRLSYLPVGAELTSGELIETSGIGGILPRGIRIGKVVSAQYEAGSQALTAVIEPTIDFSSLSQVFIITDYEISE
ncbi:MAG: rod shape-determining protein MreC [Oscillospiraceae bacterium]|nr:rod shape-determining protein MreC [Oscillospiraceae bacterium]